MREIVRAADSLRTELGTGAMGGAAIKGCAHDHDVSAGKGLWLGEIALLHAEEGEVRAIHVADAFKAHGLRVPGGVRNLSVSRSRKWDSRSYWGRLTRGVVWGSI